jgi:hypothetical protein
MVYVSTHRAQAGAATTSSLKTKWEHPPEQTTLSYTVSTSVTVCKDTVKVNRDDIRGMQETHYYLTNRVWLTLFFLSSSWAKMEHFGEVH